MFLASFTRTLRFFYSSSLSRSKPVLKSMTWKWYVYIIECEDGTYYTGMTWKPDLRWAQHLSGLGSKYTAKHKPKRLAYLEEYDDFGQARRRERQIKDWRQEKKEKLIKGEWGKW